jgi:hypothetical protein
LEILRIHDNVVVGPGGRSGVGASNGADLTTRSIVFADTAFSNNSFFGLHCRGG